MVSLWGGLPVSARLPGGRAATRVASIAMASDKLCCQGGTSRHYNGRTGPGPGAAAPADVPVWVPAGNPMQFDDDAATEMGRLRSRAISSRSA
jgi:hypothetical protein